MMMLTPISICFIVLLPSWCFPIFAHGSDVERKLQYFHPKEYTNQRAAAKKTDPSERLFDVCSIDEDDERMHAQREVDAGADINWRDPKTGQTCILRAITEGKYEVVELMLDLGANTTSNNGWPIAHLASRHGRPQIFRLFHQRNFDVTSMVKGMAPIHHACSGRQNRFLQVVQYILDNELADVNVKTSEGKTCMDLATSQQIRELLIEYGVEEVPAAVKQEL